MELRFRVFIILIMSLLVAAVWAFPVWWPIVNQETIVERFPGLELEAQADFALLPQTVQNTYLEMLADEDDIFADDLPLALVRARLLTEDVLAPEADQPFEPPSSTVVRRGEFIQVDPVRGAEGTVTIYQLNDLSFLLRLEEFVATRAPDMHVILTRNPDPYDERGVGIDYIDLGPLKGNVGGQTYVLSQSVDFSVYPIVALYSPTYDYVVSSATLRR